MPRPLASTVLWGNLERTAKARPLFCGFVCSFEGRREVYRTEGSPPQTEAADGGRAGGRAVEKE